MQPRYWISGAILLCLINAGGTRAAGTTAAEFLRTLIPADAAAVSAGVAGEGGSETLAWNPAGILGRAYPSVAVTHFASFSDTAYEQIESLLPDWLGGAWAGRLFYVSTYDFQEIDAYGAEVGELDNHDLMLQLAYARPLGKNWSAGAAVKLFESALAGFYSRGAAVDIGVRFQTPWTPLAFGAVLQNTGATTAFASAAEPLPLQAALGAVLEVLPWSGHRIRLLTDVVQPLAGDDNLWASAGFEYGLNEMLFFRGGYRFTGELGQLTLGAGMRLAGIGVDYAYQPYAELGSDHRFTVSYAFLPCEPTEPAAVAVPAAEPDKDVLVALPRAFESQVRFTPAPSAAAEPQALRILTETGRVVKTINGAGSRDIKWDGRDDQGNPIMGAEQFHFIADGTARPAEYGLPALAPVLKLQFADGEPLEPGVRFSFTARPETQHWTLLVSERKSGREQARYYGEGALPAEIVWNGLNESGAVADSCALYQYQLAVVYPDESGTVLSEAIRPVAARRTDPPEGSEGAAILILDIRFDFNRAELKPEMTDKILAAAEVLRRHPGRASARCEGHADEIGGDEYNQVLSEKRARMTAAFLGKQPGIEARTVSSVGYGKRRPVNPDNTEAGRAGNRRVEIRLTFPAPAER